MFTLELYDRKGVKLELGDIVKVSDGRDFHFFAEVKYLESEQCITPFHTYTFSFHSFEKVDFVPENAIKSTEERYNIWYLENPEIDNYKELAEGYLIEWRQCERLLDKKVFRIRLSTFGKQTELF
jgi:hypothetical protein